MYPNDKTTQELEAHGCLLPESCACPNCGERQVDSLVWREDYSGVDCTTCGHFWNPNEVEHPLP
jgi:hypothetical protein